MYMFEPSVSRMCVYADNLKKPNERQCQTTLVKQEEIVFGEHTNDPVGSNNIAVGGAKGSHRMEQNQMHGCALSMLL